MTSPTSNRCPGKVELEKEREREEEDGEEGSLRTSSVEAPARMSLGSFLL